VQFSKEFRHVRWDRPWRQAGVALPVWAHNPKLVYSPQDETWVMYHIGAGNDPGKAVNCTPGASQSKPQQQGQRRRPGAGAGEARPFEIHYSKSLSGPWLPLTAELSAPSGVGAASSASTLFTEYPGVDNVGGANVPDGGVTLHEKPEHGSGTVFISFANFSINGARAGALAWDACGGPPLTFDNGHPIEAPGSGGSTVGSLEVTGAAGVLAGSPCDVKYHYPIVTVAGPFTAKDKVVALTAETNYIEVAGTGQSENSSAVRRVGVTQVSHPHPHLILPNPHLILT